VVFVLTLFIVILLSSRTVNENISAGAVIRANSGTEPGVRKLLANHQTGFGYKFRHVSGWILDCWNQIMS